MDFLADLLDPDIKRAARGGNGPWLDRARVDAAGLADENMNAEPDAW
jgi:hypothetical protein